jgi:xanthine dehydrogenase YagR molybdenum-binding subunit
LEQAIDALAVARHEDPIVLRQRWDDSNVRQRLYTWAQALPIWLARQPVASDRGRFRRGVGVAAAGWFYITSPATRVRVETSPDGIVASTAAQDIGNGTRTVIADAIADVFGIDSSQIDVRVGDSRFLEGPMSAGSRTTMSVVPCAEDAAVWLRDRLIQIATRQLGCLNPRAVRGGIAHDGGFLPWNDLFQVAEPLSRDGERKRDKGGYMFPFRLDGLSFGKYSSGAVQVAHVEVDTRLGKVRVLETWGGYGIGRIVSQALARSQAQGGVIQGLSYALYEERRLDPATGALLTGSLDDYRIAGIGDVGPIHVHFDEGGFENARGRGAGLGEIVTVAVPASIGNAVYHATGWRPRDLPLRPDRVVEGVRQ